MQTVLYQVALQSYWTRWSAQGSWLLGSAGCRRTHSSFGVSSGVRDVSDAISRISIEVIGFCQAHATSLETAVSNQQRDAYLLPRNTISLAPFEPCRCG